MRAWTADIQRFAQHLTHERRRSPLTVAAYCRDLQTWQTFLVAQGATDWTDLTLAGLEHFLGAARQRGQDTRTLQRSLSALRGLMKFLGHAEHPVMAYRLTHRQHDLPDVLSIERVQQVLDQAAPAEDALWIRDRALLELLYSSGLRLAEIAAVTCADLDLTEGLVRVTGKGQKTRLVPVGGPAREALQQWLHVRHQFLQMPECPQVFVSQQGRPLSHRAIQARIAIRGRQAGLPQALHPHLFRHAFASHLLESSQDLRAVQELLGHSDIRATQVYTHLNFQHLAQVYDQTHPRARRRLELDDETPAPDHL